jgi:hypothetical protein
MQRRKFMKTSVAAGLLPGLAVWRNSFAAFFPDTDDLHLALYPVSALLDDYQPPSVNKPIVRASKLTYDIVGWQTGKGRRDVTCPSLGTLTLNQATDSGRIKYRVERQQKSFGKLTASFTCANDGRGTLLEWKAEHDPSEQYPAKSPWTENGKRTGDTVELSGTTGRHVQNIPSLVTCPWAMMGLGNNLSNLTGGEFAMVDAPSGIRTQQRLQRNGETPIPGSDTKAACYLQTGQAVMPTHYVIDEHGYPLFVTAFLVSFVLKDIS